MEKIIQRLLESRDATISTEIFNMKPYSEEASDLLDNIDLKVLSIVRMYGEGIDLDDTGLDGDREIRPDRTIIYRAQVCRFDKKNHKHVPLKSKEISGIESAILDKIVLPKEDENYEYEVTARIVDTDLSIKLRREKKVGW